MTTFTDNFDGASGSLLSARTGWGLLTGATGYDGIQATGLSGFLLSTSSSGSAVLAPTSQPSSPDQFAQATLTVNVAALPLGVRIQVGATFGGYFARFASGQVQLYRRSTSALTATTLTSMGAVTASATAGPFKLVAQGSSIWVEQNGTVLLGPVTDTNFSTGAIGVYTRGVTPAASVTPTVDDWSSGDLAAGVTGAAAVTLDPISGTAAGTSSIAGAAAAVLRSVTCVSTGSLAIRSTATAVLGNLSATASASLLIVSAGSATLGAVTISAAGTQSFANVGTGFALLGNVTASAAGALRAVGAGNAQLDPVVASAAGALRNGSTGNVLLDDLVVTSSAELDVSANALVFLDPVIGMADGSLTSTTWIPLVERPTVLPPRQTLTVLPPRESNMSLAEQIVEIPWKYTGEGRFRPIEWGRRNLPIGAQITSFEVVCDVGDIVVTNKTFSGTQTNMMLTGGSVDTAQELLLSVTTDQSPELIERRVCIQIFR